MVDSPTISRTIDPIDDLINVIDELEFNTLESALDLQGPLLSFAPSIALSDNIISDAFLWNTAMARSSAGGAAGAAGAAGGAGGESDGEYSSGSSSEYLTMDDGDYVRMPRRSPRRLTGAAARARRSARAAARRTAAGGGGSSSEDNSSDIPSLDDNPTPPGAAAGGSNGRNRRGAAGAMDAAIAAAVGAVDAPSAGDRSVRRRLSRSPIRPYRRLWEPFDAQPMLSSSMALSSIGSMATGGSGGIGSSRRRFGSSDDSDELYTNSSSRDRATGATRHGGSNSSRRGRRNGRGTRGNRPPVTGPNGEPIPTYAPPGDPDSTIRTLLAVSNEHRVDWNAVLHRIQTHPKEASGYTGHQAPTLLFCLERRPPLAVLQALVDHDEKMAYHRDGSGDTALHYLCGGFDVPAQSKKLRDHFPKLIRTLCERNPNLARQSNCSGCLPLHSVCEPESAEILLKAYPGGVMASNIFDGQIPLHSKTDYFIDVRDDSILSTTGDNSFLNRDESPLVVRMMVEEGLNLTWTLPRPDDASTTYYEPGWSPQALGGIFIKDRRGRSPYARVCRGLVNKLTDDGRVQKYHLDKVVHMLYAKLRIFAEASYASSVYIQARREQAAKLGKASGGGEANIPHKRISLRDVGEHPSDPPFILLHELLRLRVPPKIIKFAMRNNTDECVEVGRNGRKALHLAAEGGYDYNTILKPILDADPDVVDQPDPLTGFHPFMLAAFKGTRKVNLTSAFQLLVCSPTSARGLAGPVEEERKSSAARAAGAASSTANNNEGASAEEVRQLREEVRELRSIVKQQGQMIAQLEEAAAARDNGVETAAGEAATAVGAAGAAAGAARAEDGAAAASRSVASEVSLYSSEVSDMEGADADAPPPYPAF